MEPFIALVAIAILPLATGNIQSNSSVLYFGRQLNIVKMSTSGGIPIPLNGVEGYRHVVVTLAYDPTRNYLYWTGYYPFRLSIGRISLDTNETEAVVILPENVLNLAVLHMAVDYISNLLYLANGEQNVIQVFDFEKKTNKTLVKTTYPPGEIIVDPNSGWMYWAELNPGVIRRAHMDGSGQDNLVSNETGIIPYGLALDRLAGRLYFCDYRQSLISSVDINTKEIFNHVNISEGDNPCSNLALDENFIYLASSEHMYIYRVPKTSILEERYEVLYRGILYGLVLVGSYQLPGDNACSVNNGGCQEYCLPVPGGRVCECSVQCLYPAGPENGVVTPNISQRDICYGVTVHFSCHDGYTLIGFPSSSCMGTTFGNWTHEVPICKVTPQSQVTGIASGVVVALLGICVAVALGCYVWRRKGRFIHRIANRFTDCDEAGEYLFDAFVAYKGCETDEKFVVDQLYPKLEQEMGYKLCIHARDFLAGNPIAENISWGIKNSRRTILVLSPDFINSTWTRLEYLTAQQEMLQKKQKIIPIILRQFDRNGIDEVLDTILSSTTYIQWPLTEEEQEEFWLRVQKVMPKRDETAV